MTATWRVIFLALLICTGVVPVRADEQLSLILTIKDHRFEPAELNVPAGRPFVIRIKNLDPAVEEFESAALKIEKIIAGGSEGTVRIRGLDRGRYEFTGEFHAETAKGILIAE